MTNTIAITNLADVRDGDTVTVEFAGGVFVGPVRATVFGGLEAGGRFVRETDGEQPESIRFVSATREVPDLPTELGSVILVHEIDSRPVEPPMPAILADLSNKPWVAPGADMGRAWWYAADRITRWETCVVTPSGEVVGRG